MGMIPRSVWQIPTLPPPPTRRGSLACFYFMVSDGGPPPTFAAAAGVAPASPAALFPWDLLGFPRLSLLVGPPPPLLPAAISLSSLVTVCPQVPPRGP